MTLSREDLLTEATTIAEEYRDDGYSLTLRQLYYQCVAQAIIPNSDKSYKRLGDTLGQARLSGNFDMDLLVDRGRNAGPSKHHLCKIDAQEALKEAQKYVRSIPHWSIEVDRWFGQSTYTSVWCEKDALSGVFEGPCQDLGVGFFACKGYPSHSALWQWLIKLEEAYQASTNSVYDDEGNALKVDPIEDAVILYFGDHDPDGWQIPRSAEEALNTFAYSQGLEVPHIQFRRVALNMDQITKHKPPPFPAKKTSSRYAGYYAEHGIQDAWELDALNPKTLDGMVRDYVNRYWRPSVHQHWQEVASNNRDILKGLMEKPGWLSQALK